MVTERRSSVFLLLLAALGCSDSLGPADHVVGQWTVAGVSGPLFYGTGAALFRTNGTFLMHGQWILQNGGDPALYDVSGRYAVTATQLIWNVRGTRVTWNLDVSRPDAIVLTGQPQGSLGLTAVNVTLTLTKTP